MQSTGLHPVGVVGDQKVNVIVEFNLFRLCPSVTVSHDPKQGLVKWSAGDKFERGKCLIIPGGLNEPSKFDGHVERVLK